MRWRSGFRIRSCAQRSGLRNRPNWPKSRCGGTAFSSSRAKVFQTWLRAARSSLTTSLSSRLPSRGTGGWMTSLARLTALSYTATPRRRWLRCRTSSHALRLRRRRVRVRKDRLLSRSMGVPGSPAQCDGDGKSAAAEAAGVDFEEVLRIRPAEQVGPVLPSGRQNQGCTVAGGPV